MPQVKIPELGDVWTLSKAWTFSVYYEERNKTLLASLDVIAPDYDNWYGQYAKKGVAIKHTLPKGTVLKIERIYIRKGAKEYSSVTFSLPGIKQEITGTWSNKISNKTIRFWAKLEEVNKMFVST